jgi:putative N-acetyltransferase (TIGR04045 family)
MLETTRIWGGAIRPYLSPEVSAQVATEAWQVEAYYRVRREIFASEQGLFDGSDADDHDPIATPIVALSHIAGMHDEVVGVVRIYPVQSGVWFGGRLGVARRYRARGAVGGALIEAAVCTAHARGCTQFLATVQLRNVRYFEHHHFRSKEVVTVCGAPHHLMEADLAHFPPIAALPAAGGHGKGRGAARTEAA